MLGDDRRNKIKPEGANMNELQLELIIYDKKIISCYQTIIRECNNLDNISISIIKDCLDCIINLSNDIINI